MLLTPKYNVSFSYSVSNHFISTKDSMVWRNVSTASDSQSGSDSPPGQRVPRSVKVLIIVLVIIAIPFLIRIYRLSRIPFVKLPFDPAVVGVVTVAPEENAFELYQQAATALQPEKSPEWPDQLNVALNAETWEKVPPLAQKWLERNQKSLELFVAGARRADCLHLQPRDYTPNTPTTVSQSLRDISYLVCIEARRRESTGDLAGAWDLYRSGLRASRHIGRHGSYMERLRGASMHVILAESIVIWSRNPKLDAALLKRALSDVQEVYRLTSLPSETLKTEYFSLTRHIDHPTAFAEGKINADEYTRDQGPYKILYVFGEPEVSQRLLRLMLTNWMSQIDLPIRERAPQVGNLQLFDLPTDQAGALTAGELQDACNRSMLLSLAALPNGTLARFTNEERVRQNLLELHLAVQWYARDHKLQVPEKLELLVPQYLPTLTQDEWGPLTPYKYRRETTPLKVTLWSIGPDATDNSGLVFWRGGLSDKGRGDIILPAPQEP